MVAKANKHPWTLLGPWYRKHSSGGGKGFSGKPIIQKFASSDFINDFIKDPQHSLRFLCEDFIDRPCGSIFEAVDPHNQGNDQMKLYLDAHSRFYLVVCELHCQAPGLPRVSNDQVCEAGFVIRRYIPRYSPEQQQSLNQLYAERRFYIDEADKQNKKIYSQTYKLKKKGASKETIAQGTAANSSSLKNIEQRLDQVRQQIQATLEQQDNINETQAWREIKDSQGNSRGWTWQAVVDETPQQIEEAILPLYPLIVPKDDKEHSGGQQTIWYGLIPTFSSDVDLYGNPRFDDTTLYDIRCFVRRHDDRCTKTSQRGDCQGELIWSESTESYRLASPYDLIGTAHRPVNIKLPDTNALKQQSEARPYGIASNVRMIMPPESNLGFASNGLEMGDVSKKVNGGEQVCFMSIPLITIVALFVLNLFLPIVVFLMSLWFMLRLKFCIPPSISFGADMAADLKASGPNFAANIDFDIDIVKDAIDGAFLGVYGEDFVDGISGHSGMRHQLNSNFNETAAIVADVISDFSEQPEDERIAEELPLPEDGLLYFEKETL
jgi:hypothetical protein